MVSGSDTAATLSQRLRHSWSNWLEQLSDAHTGAPGTQRRGSPDSRYSHSSYFEPPQAAPCTKRCAVPDPATDYAAMLLQRQSQAKSGALSRKKDFTEMMASLTTNAAVNCLTTEMREQALDCGLPYQYFLGYGLVLDAQGLWASMGPCLKNLVEVQRSSPAAFEADSRYEMRTFRSREEAEPHIRSKLQEFCRQRFVAHAQVQAEPPACRAHAP
jgi:hypothetical protein